MTANPKPIRARPDKLSINGNTVLLSMFLVLALSPYVIVIPTRSDTQPNAFLLAVLLLLVSYRRKRLRQPIVWLWVLIPVAITVFVVEILRLSDPINDIRSLYNYLAFP